jgi:hypothetical protein
MATLLHCGLVSCCAGEMATAFTGIRTNFDPHAILSSRDMESVVKLANQCGVSRIAEVYTYNIHPSPHFGIGVKGVESIRGREVSFVTVLIDRETWMGRNKRPSDRPLKSIGEFWVGLGGVRTNKLTTFAVGNRTVRVQLGDGVAILIADRIVEAFAVGKVRYTDKTAKEKLKGVDLSNPSGLGIKSDTNRFSISFSCGPYCLHWVDFTLEANGVAVHKVSTLMA